MTLTPGQKIIAANEAGEFAHPSDMARAIDAAIAGQWQPIETAPKTGTPVDLWCRAPGLSSGPARVPDCWFSGGKWWRYDEQYGDDQCRSEVHNASHWMPLPQAPIQTPEPVKEGAENDG